MNKILKLLLYSTLTLFAGSSWAQSKAFNTDSLHAKLLLYSGTHPSEIV
ncbi:hypothetical protein [Mucilaginibacter calamicampi]